MQRGTTAVAKVPRPEYPRPSMVRPDWLNLNGPWEFEIDRADTGLERGLRERPLEGTITVPFCPESALSGVEDTDFLHAVWYRRELTVPESWAGRRTLLHFGAVDHDATVWVDGREVGRHSGGFTPFTVDLGHLSGTAAVVVRARDSRHEPQARGKQSTRHDNYECLYTRTTGIWQTVWAEPVADVSLARPRLTPDMAGAVFHLEQPLRRSNTGGVGDRTGWTLTATVSDGDGVVVEASVRADLDLSPRLALPLPADRVRLWDTEDPHLYDVSIELRDAAGEVVDAVATYAGLRSVSIDGKAVLLNGRPVFQRLVLDQGYYPDGLMTAPTDEALVRDIELSIEAGFNGARLHQKVFEERFLFHADRLGYLCWGEFGDWGAVEQGTSVRGEYQRPTPGFISQWLEALERDYSHPSIIGWCGLNETHQPLTDRGQVLDDVTRAMFLAAKAMDTSRPVLDASGYSHRVLESDVWDSHNYTQDPGEFAAEMAGLKEDRPHTNVQDDGDATISVPYSGQPWFCSEFGGIWWRPDATANQSFDDRGSESSWGYGKAPESEEEFHRRFEGLTGVLLEDPLMFGYCYTQLTDVFQEQNGVYSFDRSVKLDVARVRAAQLRKAAIERTPEPG